MGNTHWHLVITNKDGGINRFNNVLIKMKETLQGAIFYEDGSIQVWLFIA